MCEKAFGVVSEIVYRNDENGYTVCEVTGEHGDFTAVGSLPGISVGESVEFTGEWVTHASYGEQIRVSSYKSVLPQSEIQVLMYLSSGIIKGVGPVTAKKIVDKFGSKTLEIMRDEPYRLAEIKGISAAKAHEVHESLMSKQVMQSLVMFLQPYGITPAFALKVFRALGADAVSKIKQNPYCLCSVDGIGFKTADSLAMGMGFEASNEERLREGVLYVMREAVQNGDTYYEHRELTKKSAEVLGCSRDDAENTIFRLINENRIIKESDGENINLYLPLYYNAELGTAKRLASAACLPPLSSREKIESILNSVESENAIILSQQQREACISACMNGMFIITGGPGTGKTTIIKTIISIMERMGKTIALCAPTGRAAKRLTETCGMEGKTIHRLLEINFSEGERQSFARDETFPVDEDVVIADEMSMVDIMLMHALLKALKSGTRLIMAGDADQLPSVGAGNVLRDMLQSGVIKSARLTEIYRQASESMIIVNAHRVNGGEMPILNKKDKDFFMMERRSADEVSAVISELCAVRLPKAYGFNPLFDIQVISPSRRGKLGVQELNRILQGRLNPPDDSKNEKTVGDTVFREGDKVMQIKNNYSISWTDESDGKHGEGIFNGDIGVIEYINKNGAYLEIKFDGSKTARYEFSQLEEIELAYAVTVHKSQGSEFPAVISPMFFAPPQLMNRNLLYTALTRAKELVVLVGSREALKKMTENNKESKRNSGLCRRIKELAII